MKIDINIDPKQLQRDGIQYELTGEWRKAEPGEPFLSSSNTVAHQDNETIGHYPILRAVGPVPEWERENWDGTIQGMEFAMVADGEHVCLYCEFDMERTGVICGGKSCMLSDVEREGIWIDPDKIIRQPAKEARYELKRNGRRGKMHVQFTNQYVIPPFVAMTMFDPDGREFSHFIAEDGTSRTLPYYHFEGWATHAVFVMREEK